MSIPREITVRITGQGECTDNMVYQSVQVDFRDYVKGVLPNEWHRDWPIESLRAGAVAVKVFAYHDVMEDGFVWDCNWDQVYDPAKRTPETDNAVDDTWNRWLFVKTYYDDYPEACASRGHDCLSQWESKRLAGQGMMSRDILLNNYAGTLWDIPASWVNFAVP